MDVVRPRQALADTVGLAQNIRYLLEAGPWIFLQSLD
jgi:hypothetical protein